MKGSREVFNPEIKGTSEIDRVAKDFIYNCNYSNSQAYREARKIVDQDTPEIFIENGVVKKRF